MRTFYHLLVNTLISSITNFTVWFAITFYVYLQTQSVFATSIISGLYLVATATTGFWLGSVVDHNRKKDVMLFSSVLSLIAYFVGLGIFTLAPDGAFTTINSVWLWSFVPVLMVGVIAGNLRGIALPTMVTLLIKEDKRDKANGMVGTISGIGFMVTSVISGLLIGFSGMQLVLLLAIGLTVASMIHLWFIKVEEKKIIHVNEHGEPKGNLDIKGTLAVISKISGLMALILFATFNNFLGGVFMSLMDAYGLSLVSVQVWGLMWGFLSTGFIIGGLLISKVGLGKNPVRTLFIANLSIWAISTVFTIQPSIVLLLAGMFSYLTIMPFIEASEHTIIQKLVPLERQGRVFGFAQSVELAASPLTAFAIGPITQFIFIPFMTTGAGVDLIGDWFGTGSNRGIALVFTIAGMIGLTTTFLATRSKYYRLLSQQYAKK